MITATYDGVNIIEVDETTLRKATGTTVGPQSDTDWIEYWDGDKMVHRSVHVKLKHHANDSFGAVSV
jgi:hypothetical protein